MGEKQKKQYESGVRWIGWSAAIALASLGGWWFYARSLNPSLDPVEVKTVAAKLDTIETTITESGIVELGGQQTLKSPSDSTVDRVLVEVGDRVSEGEDLIILRNAEQQSALAVQPLETRKKQLSLARNRQKVREAEENLALAQEKLQRLTENNIERETNLAKERLNLREKQLALETQRQNLVYAREELAIAREKLAEIREQANREKARKLADLQLEIESKQLNLANARDKVIEAEENLAADQQELAELQELAAKGFIAEQEVRQQENAVRRDRTALRDAELQVSTQTLALERIKLKRQQIEREFQNQIESAEKAVREGEKAVQNAQAEIRRATFDKQRTQLEFDKLQQQPMEEIENARKAVRDAEITLRDAQLQVTQETLELNRLQIETQKNQQQYEENVVSAPSDATILEINVKNSDGIARGNDLLTLGDPAQELVKLQLSTLNAGKVELNQEARISVIGPQEETYQGVVLRLSPLATTGNGNNSSSMSGQAAVPATVKLNYPTGELIPGSQVSVEIVTQQRQDVVVLPIELIQRDGSEPYVWVRDRENTLKKQSIELGLEGVVQVEIKSGLDPGDSVVVPPPEPPLEPGMSVIVSEDEAK